MTRKKKAMLATSGCWNFNYQHLFVSFHFSWVQVYLYDENTHKTKYIKVYIFLEETGVLWVRFRAVLNLTDLKPESFVCTASFLHTSWSSPEISHRHCDLTAHWTKQYEVNDSDCKQISTYTYAQRLKLYPVWALFQSHKEKTWGDYSFEKHKKILGRLLLS